MHRGPAGAGNLNVVLQQALAPYRDGLPERRHGARVFRVGDKVIQIRNNYDKGAAGVFNGTVGLVTDLSLADRQLNPYRRGRRPQLRHDEPDELHAYAITVHRSQGSEYGRHPLTMGARTLLAQFVYTADSR
jgi:exodeoxyribonuclease V alpha subunit